MKEFELIVCIINAGFCDAVMEAARAKGAGGGTIIRARGTANPVAEKKFNRKIEEEKEVVYILAHKEKVDEMLMNIYDKLGLDQEGRGIAFSMPVERVVGLPAKQMEL